MVDQDDGGGGLCEQRGTHGASSKMETASAVVTWRGRPRHGPWIIHWIRAILLAGIQGIKHPPDHKLRRTVCRHEPDVGRTNPSSARASTRRPLIST